VHTFQINAVIKFLSSSAWYMYLINFRRKTCVLISVTNVRMSLLTKPLYIWSCTSRHPNSPAVQLTLLYRVSQEECDRLREGVPYVKIHRYNPKHLYPKLNGYGDNGQRKVWSSGGSTPCTCQLTALSMSVLECGVILRQFSWFCSESFCAVWKGGGPND
jgi:hypothetical protein